MSSRERDLVIGYESAGYAAARNVYSPVGGVRYAKRPRVPVERFGPLVRRGYAKVHVPLGPARVDLMHLWNRVSFGRAPWGASFESPFPMVHSPGVSGIARQQGRLVDPRCRFLIGMSDYAVKRFRRSIIDSAFSDSDVDEVMAKVHVVLPHQPIGARRSQFPIPREDDALRMMFIGVDFFRKGGEACLRALERAGDELNLHLTVVSAVRDKDLGWFPPPDVDVTGIRARLTDHERITWHTRVEPFEELVSIMESSHIGLLPTLSETFGLSTVEFMSSGVPTIVSAIEATPEFTGPDTGWHIHLPTDDMGEWSGKFVPPHSRRAAYEEAIESAAERIIEVARMVRSRPGLLGEISSSSRARVENQFSTSGRERRLLEIYRGALRSDAFVGSRADEFSRPSLHG